MRKAWFLVSSVIFVALVVGCSDGEQGESCDESGVIAGQCEEGLVCGKKQDDSADLVCLKQCFATTDCGQNEDCLGVAGSSHNACRPRKGT